MKINSLTHIHTERSNLLYRKIFIQDRNTFDCGGQQEGCQKYINTTLCNLALRDNFFDYKYIKKIDQHSLSFAAIPRQKFINLILLVEYIYCTRNYHSAIKINNKRTPYNQYCIRVFMPTIKQTKPAPQPNQSKQLPLVYRSA
jgi:hypothetical protein